ncbi:phage tail protein, partial [Escherichia coli]|uniref:phage tail protein n=1 Tax=Escherichia coli TaxID=562 RepID=UPI0021E93D38
GMQAVYSPSGDLGWFYPIDVVKIPLSGPLTLAFEDARDRIIAAEMPKQLGYALKQQLRLWLTR